jgi:hypothetical protein
VSPEVHGFPSSHPTPSRGTHAVVAAAGSHASQRLDGFTAPVAQHAAAMRHAPASRVARQVPSPAHASDVQVRPSLQAYAVPRQLPAEQWSAEVQLFPSLHARASSLVQAVCEVAGLHAWHGFPGFVAFAG